jgi:PAS domain S-box-containing protein
MRDEPWDPSVAATLVAEAPDMILTLDRSGRIRQANPATVRESGFTVEELRTRPIDAFLPGLDAKRITAARERSADGESAPVTVRYHRKDGSLRWLSVRFAPLAEGNAEVATLVFARDVTDEIVRTQALRESHERFRGLVAAFDRAFFVIDPDLRIAGLFGRWVRSAGLEPRDWIGRTPQQLFPATAGEPHLTAMRRAMGGEDVTYEFDYPSLRDGSTLRMRVNLSPMHDADGSVLGIAGVAADITRRMRAEDEAAMLRARVAEAERAEALAKLVSGVAHELNNPLAAMLNFTEDLLQTEPEADRRGALEVIRAQALRSRVIVRDLLTFARKGGHRPLTPQAPGPVLEAVVRALRPAFGRGVRFEDDVRDGATSLELDRAGFEQVVTNLITNAAQAAPDGGSVRLEAARDGAWYVITVTDDGPGIAPDVLPRIFEPFFTTKPTGDGSGLGLPVSLGIVREHGGTLEAGNGERGARFTVRLPVSALQAHAATPPLGVPAVRRGEPLPADAPVLLIIDDEEPIRRALRRYFERNGWRVEEAVDGREALALLERPGAELRYTAVLCDLRMPEVDGPTVYEQVRAMVPALLPRFVMTTGDVTGEAASRFLSGITTPVLEKPFELAEVVELLERLRADMGRADR